MSKQQGVELTSTPDQSLSPTVQPDQQPVRAQSTWHTTMLSPSPSPERVVPRVELGSSPRPRSPTTLPAPAVSIPSTGVPADATSATKATDFEVSAKTTGAPNPALSPRQVRLPVIYRSPPPPTLSRLDTASAARFAVSTPPIATEEVDGVRAPISPRTADPVEGSLANFALRSPPPPKTRLPAVYQHQSTKDFYPTPITVTDRAQLRWPGPADGYRQASHLPPGAQQQYQQGVGQPGAPSQYVQYVQTTQGHQVAGQSEHTSQRPMYPTGGPHLGRGGSHSHPEATYSMMRPKLSIHPYASQVDPRYFSAGGMQSTVSAHPHSIPHNHLGAPYAAGVGLERTFGSPSSVGSPSFKAPRKRADDIQLDVLTEVFERTSYPSTEERDELARRLGMTSRSVQIWFQNRRRAVKVEQQSAIQRAEADARMAEAQARGLPGPAYLPDAAPLGPSPSRSDPGGPSRGLTRPPAGATYATMPLPSVKTERNSPDRGHCLRGGYEDIRRFQTYTQAYGCT